MQRVRSTITAHVKESLQLAAYIAKDVRRPVHCPAPYSHRPLAEGLGDRLNFFFVRYVRDVL